MEQRSSFTRYGLLAWLAMHGCFGHAAEFPLSTPATAAARALDVETALRLTSEGEALFREDREPRGGYAYCSQAVAFSERGEFRQAIRAASKALFLGVRDRNEDLVAQAKRDIALAYSYAGRLDLAERYAQEALGHSAHPRNRPNIQSWGYKILGDVAQRRGEHAKALEFYQRSVREADNVLRFYSRVSTAVAFASAGDTGKAKETLADAERYIDVLARAPQGRGTLQRARAEIAIAEKDYAHALKLFRSALDALGARDTEYERFQAQDGLARVYLASGDRKQALQAYLEAVNTSQQVRSAFRSDEVKTALFGEMQGAFDSAVDLLMQAGQAERAFEVSEQGRARALLDLVRNRATAASDADLSASTAPLAAISSRLADGEAVVAYHVLPERTYAWVVRKSGLSAVTIGIRRADLARSINAFRESVLVRRTNAAGTSAQLYDSVVKPLALQDIKALTIIPHDLLHYVPFQALRSENGYLIQDAEIAYAPSGATLLALTQRSRPKNGRLFGVANPDLNDATRALPGAERELKKIQVTFQAADTYFGKDATKRRLIDGSANAAVVHIAAHASVDRVDPLYSSIYLAGPGQSGVLEAHEVFGLNLKNAALVTLSACETALGRVSRGDEIWGFTRSFLSAGASSVLVSLWPVSDESTERLMTTFYEGLAKGSSRAALRRAQLALLDDPEFSHPFFWAPFNMLGDWR